MTKRVYRRTYYIVCYVDREDRDKDGICEGIAFLCNPEDAEIARKSWEANWSEGEYVVVDVRLTKEEKDALWEAVNYNAW